MANDDTLWNLIQLFRRHLASGGFKPEAFRQEAGVLSEDEPMYAFQMCPMEDKAVLHMELLGVMNEGDDDEVAENVVEPAPQPKRQKR